MHRICSWLILTLCLGPTLYAQGLSLNWELLSNGLRGFEEICRVRFTLVNSGNQPFGDDEWALYWNQAPRGIIFQDTTSKLHIRWINGDFYEMRPQTGFTLLPGDSVVHEITFSGFMIKASDGPLGPSAINFYAEVLDAFVGMYKEAGLELKTFHTGGDEVPNKSWSASPICKVYLEANPRIGHVRNLHKDLLRRLLGLLEARGITAGGWEEVAFEYDTNGKASVHTDFADKGLIPYIWNNLWGQQDLGYRLANRGYRIVLCPVTNLYFDLAYSNDPREPGLYWAGFVDEEDAFSLLPEDLFLSTKASDMGRLFVPERDFKGMERLEEGGKANILGLQGQLWGETIKGMEMLEYYYLPKMLGLAQRAWQGMPAWAFVTDPVNRETQRIQDYSAFLHRVVQREFMRMDAVSPSLHYRIPPPGIVQRGDTLLMNSIYPGMTIKYTLDGSMPQWYSPTYTKPIRGRFPLVRAKVFNVKGRSGLESQIFTPQ